MLPAFELLRRYWKPLAVFLIWILSMAWSHNHGAENMDHKWQAIFSKQQLQAAEKLAALDATYRKKEQDRQAEMAIADALFYQALREKAHENEKLRAAVDAGAVRLRVKARCPILPAASEAAPGAGVGDGGTAELDPAARQDYFALRAAIGNVEAQLSACQAIVKLDRK